MILSPFDILSLGTFLVETIRGLKKNSKITVADALDLFNSDSFNFLEMAAIKQELARKRMQIREKIDDEHSEYALEILNDLLR